MKDLIAKFKNNKGEAEPLFFIIGAMFLLVLLVFSLRLFDLTWQRYVVKKDVLSISRLYATRWVEVYKKPDCDGTWEMCSYGSVSQSEFVKDIEDMLVDMVDETNITSTTLIISKNANGTCGGADTLLCINASDENATSSGKDWSSVKEITYGTTLYATIDVNYEWAGTLWLDQKPGHYTASNKFASERFKNDSDIVGS